MKKYKAKVINPFIDTFTELPVDENGYFNSAFSRFRPSDYPDMFEEIKEPLFVTEDVNTMIRIDEYPDYFITKDGKIWNDKKQRYIKATFDGRYLRVSLYSKNKFKFCMLHRLIAKAYLPNPDNLKCVNHIDGDKLNNSISNLEWCTASENNYHAFKTGLRVWKEKSRKKVAASLGGKPFIAYKDSKMIGIFHTLMEAESQLGVDDGNISKTLKGKLKQCNGYTFVYVDSLSENSESWIKENKPRFSEKQVLDAIEKYSSGIPHISDKWHYMIYRDEFKKELGL